MAFRVVSDGATGSISSAAARPCGVAVRRREEATPDPTPPSPPAGKKTSFSRTERPRRTSLFFSRALRDAPDGAGVVHVVLEHASARATGLRVARANTWAQHSYCVRIAHPTLEQGVWVCDISRRVGAASRTTSRRCPSSGSDVSRCVPPATLRSGLRVAPVARRRTSLPSLPRAPCSLAPSIRKGAPRALSLMPPPLRVQVDTGASRPQRRGRRASLSAPRTAPTRASRCWAAASAEPSHPTLEGTLVQTARDVQDLGAEAEVPVVCDLRDAEALRDRLRHTRAPRWRRRPGEQRGRGRAPRAAGASWCGGVNARGTRSARGGARRTSRRPPAERQASEEPVRARAGSADPAVGRRLHPVQVRRARDARGRARARARAAPASRDAPSRPRRRRRSRRPGALPHAFSRGRNVQARRARRPYLTRDRDRFANATALYDDRSSTTTTTEARRSTRSRSRVSRRRRRLAARG